MKQVKVNFENCYGIEKLKYTFNFTNDNKINFIYSPNGTMKTSFLKTFKNYNSEKNEDRPHDQINKNLKSVYEIKDGSDKDFVKEQIFTIESLPDIYKISDQVNTLLLNTELKNEFENIKNKIDIVKDELIRELTILSGLKNSNEFEREFNNSFSCENILQGLERLTKEIEKEELNGYSFVKYNLIFNDKTMQMLSDNNFINTLSRYVHEYNLLINESVFFKKGFNHYQADEISKKLKENGFFKADHYLKLSNGQEIKSEKDLQKMIDDEKARILKTIEIKNIFSEVDKKIQKNTDTREFLKYITTNPEIAKLIFEYKENINILKQKILKGYIQKNIEMYEKLISVSKESEEKINNIKKNIETNNTKWHEVVKIFNERFSVPFKVEIENEVDVILGGVPKIIFKFNNLPVEENLLKKDILSNGERRALYLLGIIFEIEIRKNSKKEILFVIDDIADSFDYKNKYAIVEYLSDISKERNFYQIILTHNYDFFRTIIKRLDHSSRKAILFAIKNGNEIIIEEAFYQNKNPLIIFKEELHNIGCEHNIDGFMPICAIPFARNIVEYTKSIQDKNYLMLTSLLHIKTDSYNIKLLDLKNILHDTINSNNIWVGYSDLNKSVIEYIYEKADFILKDGLDKKYLVRLEPKIILSIACRLKMEEFLIRKFKETQIKYEELIADKNQTRELIELLKNRLPDEYSKIEGILEKLLIITSENIHLNSFMYEPLLDISNCELIDLYRSINNMEL